MNVPKIEDLTAEYIIGLYEKHGLRPAPYFLDGRSCCGMGVLAVELGCPVGEKVDRIVRVLDAHGFATRHAWQVGFDDGLRLSEPSNGQYGQPQTYDAAYQVGAACAEWLKKNPEKP